MKVQKIFSDMDFLQILGRNSTLGTVIPLDGRVPGLDGVGAIITLVKGQ